MVGALTALSIARDSQRGRSPETAGRRAGQPLRRLGSSTVKTVCGFSPAENAATTLGEENAPKGRNPMSAAGVKQNRPGFKGRKPSGG